ncbi:MAG: methylenetetrahydrofolate reductase [NAD(P)H], partial [Acidobacteriota bacterium]|nr:methylenetetrahydrofolate reductase [NAD(P)H] [Acidobacteriota bacterium]
MRIDQILSAGSSRAPASPAFSFEFFPPKTEQGERNLDDALASLAPLEPAFVSVTYGAGGSTREKTLDIVTRIKHEHGLEAMAHLTCVGSSVEELRATLSEMRSRGIENVLALRGAPPAGSTRFAKAEDGLEYSHELVALIKRDFGFSVGAACFPETHLEAESPQSDLEHLAHKVRAGADFLITQLFFDNAVYFDFLRRARAVGIGVPIIPGILPITHFGQLTRMTEMCGASIPAGLREELRARESEPEAVLDFGVAYATLQCSELLAAGAPGIHFYTLNRSPATRAIVSALKLAKPWANSVHAQTTADPQPRSLTSISSPETTRGVPSAP